MNIENKQVNPVVLVTGSARRIGATIVEYLHTCGFDVIIHCNRSIDSANKLAKKLNQIRLDSAYVLSADLCDMHLAQKLILDSWQWHQRLDVLVYNASLFSTDDNLWQKLFTTNVMAPYWLSLAAKPYLEKTQGSIINITDIHADKPLKNYALYSQTKAALKMQTEALARELAPNIRVNAVAPGATMWPEDNNNLSDELKQHIIDKTLLKKHGSPVYIAQAVLALINNQFVTGQSLRVDGGRL